MLVPVFSSHSAQTPKARSSPAFDLQCRKSGRGKFVPLLSGPSPRFGWQRRMPCPCHTGERLCPSRPVAGGLFQPSLLAPSSIPGTTRTFSPTRSEALVKQQVVGFAIRSDSARLTHHCPPPAPLWMLASEHGAKGAGAGNACPAFDGLSRSPANFSQRLPSSSHFCMQQAGPQRRFLH